MSAPILSRNDIEQIAEKILAIYTRHMFQKSTCSIR